MNNLKRSASRDDETREVGYCDILTSEFRIDYVRFHGVSEFLPQNQKYRANDGLLHHGFGEHFATRLSFHAEAGSGGRRYYGCD